MNNAALNISSVGMLPFNIPALETSFETASIRAKHEISTWRLYLRPVSASDLEDYRELLSDPDVMQFIGIEAGYIPSREEIAQLLDGAIETWKKRGYGRWSVYYGITRKEFAGFCGFRYEEGKPELIAAFHKKFWGREIAVEAAEACLKYGYQSLGFTAVKAYTRPENKRARRALEKLLAEFEGDINFHGITGASYNL